MSEIHPTALVDHSVELGLRVSIGPFAVVQGPCRVEDDVWIGPHASVGTPAQLRHGPHRHSDGAGDSRGITIGERTVVREFVTIHQGSTQATSVGADCYIMAYAHVPHDARIGTRCTLSNSVQLGGHTIIGDDTNLGLGAVVHQRSVIGEGAMVGMQAAVTRPVPPYATVTGCPAAPRGANTVAIERLHGPVDAKAWAQTVTNGPVTSSTAVPRWAGHAVKRYLASCIENGWVIE